MTLYDITRPVTPALAGWPGDTRYSTKRVLDIAGGDAVNVSALRLSTHLGSHADAPAHFLNDGETIDQLPLEPFLGPALVADFSDVDGALTPAHLARLDLEGVQRLLIRTHCSTLPDAVWPERIVYPTVAAIELLGRQGLRLFGTDCPSVDPLDSKTLDAHHALHAHDIAILEGLWLKHAPLGRCELIAPPIKLDGDGAPVRALLRVDNA